MDADVDGPERANGGVRSGLLVTEPPQRDRPKRRFRRRIAWTLFGAAGLILVAGAWIGVPDWPAAS